MGLMVRISCMSLWSLWPVIGWSNRCLNSAGMQEEISHQEASSNDSFSSNNQKWHSNCSEAICKSDEAERLTTARKLGVLKLSPSDELEGEIIYLQHKLLWEAVGRKRLTGLCALNFPACVPLHLLVLFSVLFGLGCSKKFLVCTFVIY